MNIYKVPLFFFLMYLYLQLLCIFVVVPNIILLYVNRKKIHLKALCIALLVLFLIAVLWDQVSVRMGLWIFSQSEILWDLFGLPIEEYLFFLFVPLLSINIYLLIEGFVTNYKKMKVKKDE
jgi:lycopene cyclase domain-containing protein